MFRKTKIPAPKLKYFYVLMILVTILLVLGIGAVFNASAVEAQRLFDDKYYFAKQQLKWVIIGSIGWLTTFVIPVGFWKKVSPILFGVGVLLMILVLIPGIGDSINGARRWINLGGSSLQPSEPLKFFLILYFSAWLEKQSEKKFKGFLVVLGLVATLAMLQPDLGTTIVLTTISFSMYYLSGADLKKIYVLFAVVLLAAAFFVVSSPYRRDRLHTYLDPTADPQGKSYHINQALVAIGSGGWTGVGIGRSRQKYAYLPMASTDSIFAVISEETGFAGGLVLIGTYVAIIVTAFKIALSTDDKFESLLAGGVACWLLAQFGLNMAAMVALIPLTGVPLPLISYGGSALVSVMMGIGILANIGRRV
jgi:cell division protein FtsW